LRIRFGLVTLVVIVVSLAALWIARAPVLAAVGRLVVEEGAPGRADAIVVLASNRVVGAAEAAQLYRRGHAARVVLVAAPPGADEQILARLELGIPGASERAALVLTRLGVPRAALVVQTEVDGTNSGVRTIARWARGANARQLIVVADRAHSRRIGTLLRRRLDGAAIVMRTSPHDGFDPERWWRTRGMTRELVMEGLRWINSVVLGDLWVSDE
jgi:uncharacterized SAM-binding protein YcdF (DUF218 family)